MRSLLKHSPPLFLVSGRNVREGSAANEDLKEWKSFLQFLENSLSGNQLVRWWHALLLERNWHDRGAATAFLQNKLKLESALGLAEGVLIRVQRDVEQRQSVLHQDQEVGWAQHGFACSIGLPAPCWLVMRQLLGAIDAALSSWEEETQNDIQVQLARVEGVLNAMRARGDAWLDANVRFSNFISFLR